MTNNLIYDEQIKQAMEKYGVSWFKFDEDSGNVTDSKGTAVGTVYANVARVEGWNGEGKALSFNRTSTSYVQFSSRVIPNGEYTLRFKMKLFTIPTAENQEVFNNAYAMTTEAGLRVWVNTAGQIVVVNCIKNNSSYDFALSANVSFDSEWHDYMIAWDTTNKIVSLYVDNILVNQSNSNTQNTLTASYNLRIGRQVDSEEKRYFEGELDDVQVYNKALTPLDFILNKTLILSQNEYKKWNEEVPQVSEEDIVPTLTKDDGNVIYSHQIHGNEAWKIFNGINNITNSLISGVTLNNASPQFFGYKFSEMKKIKSFSVQARNGDGNDLNGMPLNMSLQYSLDNTNWLTEKTFTNIQWINSTPSSERKVFELDRVLEAKAFRISITDVFKGNINSVLIGEVEFISSPSDKIPSHWSTHQLSNIQLEGMDSLSPILDRRVTTLEPQKMNKSEILLENGKVFSKTLDLKKYIDIRSINTEVE